MKGMVATQIATQKAAEAIESSPIASERLGEVVGKDAINNLYGAGEGKNLTKADVDTLNNLLGDGFAEEWHDMTDFEKKEWMNTNTFSSGI
jgi:hypothetical protein